MAIKLGNLDISSFKVGSADCKVYLGETLLYSGDTPTPPTHDYSLDYLTFVATESGTFKFIGNSINYSLDDGNTWTSLESDTNSPTVSAGNKILWKESLTPTSSNGIGRFSSSGNFTVEGNAMSLLYGDNFVGQTDLSGKDYAFYRLFSGNTNVTSAENIILPATTLADNCYNGMFYNCKSLTTAPSLPATNLSGASSCYYSMFNGCTSLTTAPSLPATTLESSCYSQMFRNCTSLTTVPSNMLPATTLAQNCYTQMFAGCESLTTAPVLSATTLATRCYGSMFQNCKNLNSITCLATDMSAAYCTNGWVRGVASSGTFTKAASMSSWTTGNNGIPSGWTVEDYVS